MNIESSIYSYWYQSKHNTQQPLTTYLFTSPISSGIDLNDPKWSSFAKQLNVSFERNKRDQSHNEDVELINEEYSWAEISFSTPKKNEKSSSSNTRSGQPKIEDLDYLI